MINEWNDRALTWFTDFASTLESTAVQIARSDTVNLQTEVSFFSTVLSDDSVPTIVLAVKGTLANGKTVQVLFKVCYEPKISLNNLQIYEKDGEKCHFLDIVPLGHYDEGTLKSLVRTLFLLAEELASNEE